MHFADAFFCALAYRVANVVHHPHLKRFGGYYNQIGGSDAAKIAVFDLCSVQP